MVISMFRHRHRRDVSDFMDWTDYSWNRGPMRRAWASHPWGRRRRRGRGLLSMLLALAVVWVAYRLLRRRTPLAW